MKYQTQHKHAVVSLSGGMDSSTLLLKCIHEFETVTAMSFDYGQKHKVELKRAQALVDYLRRNGHGVKYQVIKLDGLVDLLDSALVEGGDEVPEGHYAEENMKATVVPNRNKIFASLVQAAALSISNRTKEDTAIALGIHAGDHAVYPDCRQEFRDADDNAFRLGNWDAEKVGYYTPYLNGDKYDILLDPIYTSKMAYGVLNLMTNNFFKPNSKILMIQTGGHQGILPMNKFLKEKNLTTINY